MPDKALLLGINDYAHVSDLRGCENDVRGIGELLIGAFGFSEDRIRRHINEEVTKPAVRDGFRWLVADAQPGDRLVFHFSGHGSYTPSENDDEAVDELLCLYDMTEGDPETFLLDDELGELAASTPEGVRLTVILDSCYSGTGTRALGVRRAKTPLIAVAETALRLGPGEVPAAARKLTASSATAVKALSEEPEKLVLARFVPPSPKVAALAARRTVRKLGLSLRTADLNHQLLSAASDSQTAADAFLDGDYRGAFSWFLAKAAGSHGRATTTEAILDDVRASLLEGGFSQTPQLEGPFAQEPLFGGPADMPPPVVRPDAPTPSGPPAIEPPRFAPVPAASSPPAATLDRLLTLAERFLDVVDRLSRTPQEAAAPFQATTLRATTEAVVYVHGISQHRPGYSDAWWDALRPHLARSLSRKEVVWSDIVNPRSAPSRAALARATPDEAALRRRIEEELARRIEAEQQAAGRSRALRAVTERAEAAVRGNGLSIDDFLRYMLDATVRSQILQRFDAVVRPLLDNGATVHVVSHSWGTVVAYEGLRQLDAQSLSGRVANLFVLGSALSIGAVRSNLFGRVADGRRPAHVDRIFNLDAGGDPIGGPIGDAFEVDGEHLGLRPTGCATIPFTSIAVSPFCAHGSYFTTANQAVQRDLLAARMNG